MEMKGRGEFFAPSSIIKRETDGPVAVPSLKPPPFFPWSFRQFFSFSFSFLFYYISFVGPFDLFSSFSSFFFFFLRERCSVENTLLIYTCPGLLSFSFTLPMSLYYQLPCPCPCPC